MKIEHITNSYLKFDIEVVKQLSTCSSFSIATAFINSYTIDLLEDSLKRNKVLKSARVLIGVYQNFNRQKNLLRLS
jgi:HKD family nuclease